MSINLIPNEYRVQLRKQQMIVRSLFAVVIVNGLLASTALALKLSTQQTNSDIATLRTANAIAEQQSEQLVSLKATEEELRQRWSLLRGLRAGAAIEDIFAIIDRSVVMGDLWFLNWRFLRAGVTLDGRERDIETGYFIVVDTSAEPRTERRFEVRTEMSISGQAKDHQALSEFVRALYSQPDVVKINLAKTTRGDYGAGVVVNFDLSISLTSDGALTQ